MGDWIMSTRETVNANSFYSEYSGHKVRHLQKILPGLRAASDRIVWTAGDSSLDNKYWFDDTAPAAGEYQSLLQPPASKQDVVYWMNRLCEQDPSGRRQRTAAINTAVEASTLNERTFALRPQDKFLRDNISENDVLVVSVGGNDIALLPCPCTIASILGILCLPPSCIEKGCACGAVPVDDCCCGCGPSLCSCLCACPPCLGYFRHLFGTRIERYIKSITSKRRPAKILVCMIYYPDERNYASWASPALGALGYNTNPTKLQMLIRKAYEEAISNIQVPGSQVIPTPLFRVLDGTNTNDYVARVEPSPMGGRKMAEFILDMIDQQSVISLAQSPSAPLTSNMDRRS